MKLTGKTGLEHGSPSRSEFDWILDWYWTGTAAVEWGADTHSERSAQPDTPDELSYDDL